MTAIIYDFRKPGLRLVSSNQNAPTFEPEHFLETVICFLVTSKDSSAFSFGSLETGLSYFGRAFEAMRGVWATERNIEWATHRASGRWHSYHRLKSNYASSYSFSKWLETGSRVNPSCVQALGSPGECKIQWYPNWRMPLVSQADREVAAKAAMIFRTTYLSRPFPPPMFPRPAA